LKPGKIESHPGRLLEDHLLKTSYLAEKLAAHYLGQVPANLRLACLLHDVAKAHAKFQERLKGRGRFPHAEPSAYIALCLSRDIILSEIIRCHHTHIKNNFISDFWCNTNYLEIKRTLVEVPLWPGGEALIDKLGIDFTDWQHMFQSAQEWDDLLEELEDKTNLDINSWIDFKLLYSLLITADRLDAINGGSDDIIIPSFNIPGNVIERYLKNLKTTPLSSWRDQLRNTVLENAENTISGPGVYTLTLPTGAGKTILSLEIALKIARKECKQGIFYILPFITVVEQNSEIAKSIFSMVQEDHHLAYESKEEDMNILQRFISIFRYWNEPVVVSTFAKLWDVLYSPRSNDSMSFHRLANSIVLLDEPQSIPARYWKSFGNTLELVASRMNTTFILITATQPEIAKGKEIAPKNINVPRQRYLAIYLYKPIKIDQMLDILLEYGLADVNAMIVVNTRREALKILFSAKDKNIFAQNPFFLSGWVTPFDRKKIMKKIKEREDRQMPRHLISTQVVEAGVDLDFELVARDIAPLDSLIQVAGRCNRHMSNYKGKVYIFEIIDDKGKKYVNKIYDSILINFTREVLLKYKNGDAVTFSELDVPYLLKNYYSKLVDALEDQGPWFDIQHGRWGESYSLINEHIYESTVFIDRTGEIKSIINEISNLSNKLENKDKRHQLWKMVQEHSISVPDKELEQWYNASGSFILTDENNAIEKISTGLWIVNPKGINHIYHEEIGFIPHDNYNEYFKNQAK